MDIALGAVFDLVPEHIHRLHGHVPLGLLHGGQLDSGQGSGGDVVKADEAQLARDVDMGVVRRLQNAQGVGVRGGEDGGVVDGLGEELFCKLVAVVDGGAGKLAVEEPGGQPQLLTGPDIALRPELVGGGVAAAEIENVPVAQLA